MTMTRVVVLSLLSLLLLHPLIGYAAAYGVTYASGPIPILSTGQTVTVPVTVTNTGTITWGSNVFLSYHWYTTCASRARVIDFGGLRTPLPSPVPAGGSVTLNANLRAPNATGDLCLRWDMVQRTVASGGLLQDIWFSQQGVATANLTVTVTLQAGPPPLPPAAAQTAPLVDPTGWRQYRGDAGKTGWHLWFGPEPAGQVVWRREIGNMIDSSPVVAPGTGTIYVGTYDVARALVAINPDGTEKWAVPLGGLVVRTAPAIRNDGLLVVVAFEYQPDATGTVKYDVGRGKVFLIDPSSRTGLAVSDVFSTPNLSTPNLSAPMLDADDNVYVLAMPPGSRDLLYRFVYTFDHQFEAALVGGIHYDMTGGGNPSCPSTIFLNFACAYWPPVFRFPQGQFPPAIPSPAFAPPNLVVMASGKMVVDKPGVGREVQQLWAHDIPAMTTPAIHGGMAYVPTFQRRVEARELTTGRKTWEVPLTSYPAGPPALGHAPSANPYPRLVYVATFDGYLYFFNRAASCSSPIDPRCMWRQRVGTSVGGAPVVLSIGGGPEIVVVSGSNVLHAFRQDGTPLWSIQLDSPAYGSPAVVNGRIYVATQNYLYAIR